MTSIPLAQPDIYLWEIRIQEPMTVATDLLITLVCYYAFWILRQQKSAPKSINFIKYYFLFMGTGTMIGGLLGHGFQYAFDEQWKLLGWLSSMIGIMFIERSAITQAVDLMPQKWHSLLLKFNLLELAVAMFLIIASLNFRVVQYHAVFGFLGIVSTIHLYLFYKNNNLGSRYILTGIGTLVMAMFVFDYPISLHQWFNHKDLSHLFIVLATYYFLQGALNFETVSSKKIKPERNF